MRALFAVFVLGMWLFALILGLLLIVPAFAHDWRRPDGSWVHASWIQKDSRYRRGSTHCCGRADCAPVPPGRLRYGPLGWRVEGWEGVLPPDAIGTKGSGIYRTPEGIRNAWACHGTRWKDGKRVRWLRCLFIPGGGG